MGAARKSPARWRRRKDERPGEIAEAALACFAERGFAACSVDAIAARAGVTKGTVYLYFPNKEELFKAVVRQALVPRVASFEKRAATGASATAQLEAFVAAWPEVIAAPLLGIIPKLMIAESGNFPDLVRFYLDEVIDRARRVVIGILRRGMAQGEFRRVDATATFFSVIGPLLLAVLWRQSFERFDETPLDVEALCRSHAALIVAGLAPRKEKP